MKDLQKDVEIGNVLADSLMNGLKPLVNALDAMNLTSEEKCRIIAVTLQTKAVEIDGTIKLLKLTRKSLKWLANEFQKSPNQGSRPTDFEYGPNGRSVVDILLPKGNARSKGVARHKKG